MAAVQYFIATKKWPKNQKMTWSIRYFGAIFPDAAFDLTSGRRRCKDGRRSAHAIEMRLSRRGASSGVN